VTGVPQPALPVIEQIDGSDVVSSCSSDQSEGMTQRNQNKYGLFNLSLVDDESELMLKDELVLSKITQ
jgi:hypothetical protein